MSVTYNVTTINARLNDVINNIDAGPSFGNLRLLTATAQTVGLIALLKPSATVANGVLTFSGLPLGAPTLLNGQITAADIEDSTGTVVVSGLTVGQSTAFDIVMPITIVTSGTITLNFATITGR